MIELKNIQLDFENISFYNYFYALFHYLYFIFYNAL